MVVMDCGGKRSASPLFFRLNRVTLFQLTVRSKAPSSLRSAGAVHKRPPATKPAALILFLPTLKTAENLN